MSDDSENKRLDRLAERLAAEEGSSSPFGDERDVSAEQLEAARVDVRRLERMLADAAGHELSLAEDDSQEAVRVQTAVQRGLEAAQREQIDERSSGPRIGTLVPFLLGALLASAAAAALFFMLNPGTGAGGGPDDHQGPELLGGGDAIELVEALRTVEGELVGIRFEVPKTVRLFEVTIRAYGGEIAEDDLDAAVPEFTEPAFVGLAWELPAELRARTDGVTIVIDLFDLRAMADKGTSRPFFFSSRTE